MKRSIAILLLPLLSTTLLAHATTKPKPAAKTAPKPAPNTVKGQTQLAGLNGQFGTTFSTKNGFNITVLSARYDINAFPTPSQIFPAAEEKLLIIGFAIKNSWPNDNWFNPNGLFTAVDQNGELYQMSDTDVVQKSQNVKTNITLRPAQGIGQVGTPDTLEAVIKVSNMARIVKIMLNRERLNSNDTTIRYYIAGATKAEAGAQGDPKNVIAPLPDEVKDPADASGATALAEGKGTIGKAALTRFVSMTVDSVAFAPAGTKVEGNAPEDGKKFVVATITLAAPTLVNGPDYAVPYDWPGSGNDGAMAQLVDADGEKYTRLAARKAKRDENLPDTALKGGESYSYRVFWAVPKDATLKKLTLGAAGARNWAYDVSNVK